MSLLADNIVFSTDYTPAICHWDSCGITFDDPEQLYTHLCEFHVGRKAAGNLCLECRWKDCDVTKTKRDHITSHLKVHVPYKPHYCNKCGKKFKRPQDLVKHEKTHFTDFQYAQRPRKDSTSSIDSLYTSSLAGMIGKRRRDEGDKCDSMSKFFDDAELGDQLTHLSSILEREENITAPQIQNEKELWEIEEFLSALYKEIEGDKRDTAGFSGNSTVSPEPSPMTYTSESTPQSATTSYHGIASGSYTSVPNLHTGIDLKPDIEMQRELARSLFPELYTAYPVRVKQTWPPNTSLSLPSAPPGHVSSSQKPSAPPLEMMNHYSEIPTTPPIASARSVHAPSAPPLSSLPAHTVMPQPQPQSIIFIPAGEAAAFYQKQIERNVAPTANIDYVARLLSEDSTLYTRYVYNRSDTRLAGYPSARGQTGNQKSLFSEFKNGKLIKTMEGTFRKFLQYVPQRAQKRNVSPPRRRRSDTVSDAPMESAMEIDPVEEILPTASMVAKKSEVASALPTNVTVSTRLCRRAVSDSNLKGLLKWIESHPAPIQRAKTLLADKRRRNSISDDYVEILSRMSELHVSEIRTKDDDRQQIVRFADSPYNSDTERRNSVTKKHNESNLLRSLSIEEPSTRKIHSKLVSTFLQGIQQLIEGRHHAKVVTIKKEEDYEYL